MSTPETPRKHIVETASYWYAGSKRANNDGDMSEAVFAMEQAYNHTENALAASLKLLEEWFKSAREDNTKRGLGDYWSEDSSWGRTFKMLNDSGLLQPEQIGRPTQLPPKIQAVIDQAAVVITRTLFNHMLGTLETLLGGLEEGEDIGSLLNYINIHVRAVVEQAGGKVPPPADCSPYLKKIAAVDQLIEALQSFKKSVLKYWDPNDKHPESPYNKAAEALKNAGVTS